MLGIVLSLMVAICYGISATMQKYAVSSIKKFSFRGLIKNRNWIIAIAIGGVGTLMYIAALRLAPLSTVQSLLSLSIIIPILSGAFLFKEKLEARKWISIVLIITGIFLVSVY